MGNGQPLRNHHVVHVFEEDALLLFCIIPYL